MPRAKSIKEHYAGAPGKPADTPWDRDILTPSENSDPAPLTRKQLADKVGDLISNDRNETHGDPHIQFKTAIILKRHFHAAWQEAQPERVLHTSMVEAVEMICTKLSRIACGKPIQDHFLDICGYALIAAEVAEDK